MSTVEPIKIDGLRELQRALKDMDGESQKQLRLVLNDVSDIVVSGARRLVPSRSGAARGTLKAQSSQREARVKGGSARVPYYPWLDFGGRAGNVSRPFLKSGRYIFATYNQRKPWIYKRLEEGLRDLIEKSGMGVS